jgi:plastocyanin
MKEASVSVWKMAVVVAGTALVLTGCGGGDGTSSSGTSACSQTGGTTTGSGSQVVKLNSDPNTIGRYDPATLNLKVGDTVEFDWVDSSSRHSVSADDGSFESCLQSSGYKFVVTFSKAGDFKYHCQIHAQMLGDVKVS